MTLNGWRRLWVIWAVVAIPLSLVLVNLLGLPSSGVEVQRELTIFREASTMQASDRMTAALERELGPTSDQQEIARRASLVLARLLKQDDKDLRDDYAALEAAYEPKIAAAMREDRRTTGVLVAVVWFALSAGVYLLGSVTAWVLRGFKLTNR